MAKLAILSIKGEDGFWLVDFNGGTVSAIHANSNEINKIARNNGEVLSGGIDVAVTVETKDPGFSGRFFQSA